MVYFEITDLPPIIVTANCFPDPWSVKNKYYKCLLPIPAKHLTFLHWDRGSYQLVLTHFLHQISMNDLRSTFYALFEEQLGCT